MALNNIQLQENEKILHQMFHSPISPFADELFLSSFVDADSQRGNVNRQQKAFAKLFLGENAEQQSKEPIAAEIEEAAIVTQSTPEKHQQQQQHPPPTAFLTLATITIQLSMLRQLSRNESTADLASATCDGLLQMMQPMQVRALRELSAWESSVMDQISTVMEDLASTSLSLRDNVKSLLLSFAVQRASLASILNLLRTLSQQSAIKLAPQTVDLVRRLGSISTEAPLQCNWSKPSRYFPIRGEVSEDNHNEQRFIAASSDSSFVFVSTRKQLVKVGTGDYRVLGSIPTVEGKIYASSPFGGFVFILGQRLFSAVRRRGSAIIEIFQRDFDTLEVLPSQQSKFNFVFNDYTMVENESLAILSTLGDDKGGKTISWIGPNGWIQSTSTKSYFEVTVKDDSGTLAVGWCEPGFGAADNLRLGGAGDNHCWGIDVLAREKFAEGVRSSWGIQFKKGDVVGCALEIDSHGKAIVSFSYNGAWEFPVGIAFEIPRRHSAVRLRPIVSYSCEDEHDAPKINFGGVYGSSANSEPFRFSPPFQEFLPVCEAVAVSHDLMQSYPPPEDTAYLPPLAGDGQRLYHVWIRSEEIHGGRGIAKQVLILETYGLTSAESSSSASINGLNLKLIGKKSFRRSQKSEAPSPGLAGLKFPSVDWRMATNGYTFFLGLVSTSTSAQIKSELPHTAGSVFNKCGLQFVADDPSSEYSEVQWNVGVDGFDMPLAISFDPIVNSIWGWNDKQNLVYTFENAGLAQHIPSLVDLKASTNASTTAGLGPASTPSSSSSSSVGVCEFILGSIARLAKPYLIEVPVNINRTYCCICDHPEIAAIHERDLFLEPSDPSILKSVAVLLDFALRNSSDIMLESILSLLVLNLHVLFCTRGPYSTRVKHSLVDEESVVLLKQALFQAVARKDESVARLARKCLVEAIPVFWPAHHDKVSFIRDSFSNSNESDAFVCERMLYALNDQLCGMNSFPVHRTVVDDSMIQGLLQYEGTTGSSSSNLGGILLREAGSAVIMGLLISAFNHLKVVAGAGATANDAALPALRKSTMHPGMSGKIEEEESKEEENSSQNTGGGANTVNEKSPGQICDDVLGLIFSLLDKCAVSGFTTCLARKALPLALVSLNSLMSMSATRARITRSLMRIEVQARPNRLANLALSAVKALDRVAATEKPTSFSYIMVEMAEMHFTSRSFPSSVASSNVPNVNMYDERHLTVEVPFAYRLVLSFDARSELSPSRETIQFSGRNTNSTNNRPAEPIGVERGYSGRSLPGVDSPPLLVDGDFVECVYTSAGLPNLNSTEDGAEALEDRFLLAIEARRAIKSRVKERHWLFYSVDAFKELLSQLVKCTVGSSAFALTPLEFELMRWVQNAVFSGGLRSIEDFPPRPSLKRGSRSSVYSSGEFKSLMGEEAESLLSDLLQNKCTPPSLAGAFIAGMRHVVNRVPFDQGKMTQPAVCAIAAALIRTNGLETEAVSYARTVSATLEVGSQPSIRAPPRLRAVWSAAQMIRAWCDALVVNGRAKRHLEACGVDTVFTAIESKDDEDDDGQSEQDFEYEALCQLVVSRCEFLIRSVYPPPFLRVSRKREDALARWHFLRERFCPLTSRYVEKDPLGAVCKGILALVAIKRMPSSPAGAGYSKGGGGVAFVQQEPLHTPTGAAAAAPNSNSPPILYTPNQSDVGRRSLKKLVSSDDILQPIHLKLTRSVELTRRASLSSWGPAMRRKQSWFGVDTIDEFAPSNLSSPASSAGGSNRSLFRRGSMTSTTGSVRMRSRAEGGLRRASIEGIVEDVDVVDVARVEHEQSLSESVLSFVQTPSVLRKRDLVAVLKARNERAQARANGLAVVVALAQSTDFHSKQGRDLFEHLLDQTMVALRGCGFQTSSNLDQSLMEAHYLTDLAGCSVVWRERVTAIYLALLRIVSHQISRVAHNFRFYPQSKACAHIRTLLKSVVLDYVETDYSILFRSNIVEAIKASLALPRECQVRNVAWKVFEILFKRCVVDNVDRSSAVVGHVVQQQLMDVLLAGVSGSVKLEHVLEQQSSTMARSISDEEDDGGTAVEEGDESTEGSSPAPLAATTTVVEKPVAAMSSSIRTTGNHEDPHHPHSSPGGRGATLPLQTDLHLLFGRTLALSHAAARFLSRLTRVSLDFSMQFTIQRTLDATFAPGRLVCIGGDRTRRWSWLELVVETDGTVALQILPGLMSGGIGENNSINGGVVLRSQTKLNTRSPYVVCVTASKGKQIRLMVIEEQEEDDTGLKGETVQQHQQSNDSCAVDFAEVSNISSSFPSSASPTMASRVAGGFGRDQSPSPPQMQSRGRRLSSRMSDSATEAQMLCLLAGHVFIGSRPGLGFYSAQGITVTDVHLWNERVVQEIEFFSSNNASTPYPQEKRQKSSSPPTIQGLRIESGAMPHVNLEQVEILRSLDLAYSAARKASSIATARLSTPAAQSALLTIVSDSKSPLSVRVSACRILRSVLRDVSPDVATLNRLALCVSRAMPPIPSRRNDVIQDPRDTCAIANEVIDLVHLLCEKPGSWSLLLSTWVVQQVGFLDRIGSADKLSRESDAVRDAFVALAFCGGRLDSVRVGGKAIVIPQKSSAITSAFSQFVRIVSHESVGETEVVNISSKCKLFISSESTVQQSQQAIPLVTRAVEDALPPSDFCVETSSPCTLVIESPSPFQLVQMYVSSHRADSPKEVSIRVGVNREGLRKHKSSSFEVPCNEGWVTLYSSRDTNSIGSESKRKVGSVQDISNAEGALLQDPLVMSVHVFDVWGVSNECRIRSIRVFATHAKSALGEVFNNEDRFVCISTLEDDDAGEDEEDEEREEMQQQHQQQNQVQSSSSAAAAAALPVISSGPHTSSSSLSPVPIRESILLGISALIPFSSQPPKSIVEGVSMAASHEIFEAFHRLLASLQKRMEVSRGMERRLTLDLLVRILKSVCIMVRGLVKSHHPSKEMASFLLKLCRSHNSQLLPVPVAARFKRTGVPEHWKIRFASSAATNDDSVKFESPILTSTAWPHRYVVVDVDFGLSGIHSWTFTLVQDGARGDESVLFGLCGDRNGPPLNLSPRSGGATAQTEGSGGEEEELDLLAPNAKFHFLRAFDGSAIGAHPPSPMLCVRVGDSLRCELDLDRGTFSMAVNNRPMVCVFMDVAGPVWPCVATYAERGTVVVSMTNMKCTPSHPRRKCAVECQNLTDIQVEALSQQAFHTLCADGEDAYPDTEERSLTFVGGAFAEEEDEENENGKDGDGPRSVGALDPLSLNDDWDSAAEDDDALRLDPSALKIDTKAEASSSALLLNKAPVLYRIEEASTPLGNVVGDKNQSLLPEVGQHAVPNNGATTSELFAGKQLSPVARYEALLWELLARYSRRAFDACVEGWQPGVVSDDYITTNGLGDALASLYRVRVVKDSSLELLKSINEKSLMDLATKRIVQLGQDISHVKRSLKRSRRKPDPAT